MSDQDQYPVDEKFARQAWINNDDYLTMYAQSVSDPDTFWRQQANHLDWIKPFTEVKNTSNGI